MIIPPPPTDIPKQDGRFVENVSSVIRGLLTKICEETGYRIDSCRVSSEARYPGPVEVRGKFHRFFNDLRLSSLINAVLISMNFENI